MLGGKQGKPIIFLYFPDHQLSPDIPSANLEEALWMWTFLALDIMQNDLDIQQLGPQEYIHAHCIDH